MKKILTYLSILTAAFLFTPNSAEARPHSHGSTTYVSGYSSCGCPMYTKKVFVRHGQCGTPIYSYFRLASKCNCHKKSYRSNNHYNSHRGYNSRNSCSNNSRYYNSRHYSNRYTSNRYSSNRYYNRGSRVRVSYCR